MFHGSDSEWICMDEAGDHRSCMLRYEQFTSMGEKIIMRTNGCNLLCVCLAIAGLLSAGALQAEDSARSTVRSLNGLKGKLTLSAGSLVSITRTGSRTLTIGATGLTLGAKREAESMR